MLLQGECNGRSLASIMNAKVLVCEGFLSLNYSEITVSILMKFGKEVDAIRDYKEGMNKLL